MKEYIATGTLTMAGVTFYIKAKSLDDAWVRLAIGGYDSYDTSSAQVIDSDVRLASTEENT